MALTRQKKQEMQASYRELLTRSQAVIITRYGGLNMPQLNKVRGQVRGAHAEFHVTKNTVMALALQEAGYRVPEEWLIGSTSVSFCFGDPPAAAKAIKQLADELENFNIVGAVMAGQALDVEGVKTLAAMPPLEILRAQLIGVISSPASGVVGAINAAVGSIMYALQARIDKEQPAPAEA